MPVERKGFHPQRAVGSRKSEKVKDINIDTGPLNESCLWTLPQPGLVIVIRKVSVGSLGDPRYNTYCVVGHPAWEGVAWEGTAARTNCERAQSIALTLTRCRDGPLPASPWTALFG